MTINPGDLINITIKGVRVVNHPSARLVRIADEHGDTYDMPPQAAIEQASAVDESTEQDDRITKVLAVLDGLEAEGYIQPYVAAVVRKEASLPPRHWPPRPGDIWSDGCPFTDLWFARRLAAEGPGWSEVATVMTCVEADVRTYTPDELLKSSPELTLIHRKRDER